MSPSRHPLLLVPSILLLLPGLAACNEAIEDGRGPGEAWYDSPHHVPEGVPFDGPLLESSEEAVESPEECGRGRGIDSDGNCVRLFTEELEFGGMVQIPAGTFLRGDIPLRYDARAGRERPHVALAGQPLRQQTLENFWIDGFEIPRAAYEKCVSAGTCSPASCLDGSDGTPTERAITPDELKAFPQTCVSHEQAESYCEWRGARLPTEGEWEYAARGPKGWIFPWGHEIRDELGLALGPVGYDPLDVSYFGLKGFGGNAVEWVADSFDPDGNVSHYLAGPFRTPDGPMAKNWAAWQRELCGGSDCELGERFVVKGGRTGARAGAWQLAEGLDPTPPEENFESDRTFAQHPRLGFRCAKDHTEGVELTVPEGTLPPPLARREGGYELFLAIGEAVDRAEAERFCTQLVAPADSATGDNGWRLPTLEEVNAVDVWFGGPGPFWTAEGAAEQVHVDTKVAVWEAVEAADDEALMVRCVRSGS